MQTKVIAHRGAWKEFNVPQNSIASLKNAIDLQCFGSEFDVHLTKDDIVVVNHDHDFYGLDIETNNYNDLLQLKHPNNEQIPTLQEYFAVGLQQSTTKLILEVKSSNLGIDRTKKMIDVIAATLPNNANSENLEFILFDFEAALYTKKMLPKFNVHYLNGDKTAQEIKTVGLNGMDYHYKLLIENTNIVPSFKKYSLKTNSWTVNDLEVGQQLIQQGIDYLTTDTPRFFIEKGL